MISESRLMREPWFGLVERPNMCLWEVKLHGGVSTWMSPKDFRDHQNKVSLLMKTVVFGELA